MSGEQLPPGTNIQDEARLDISCRGFYSTLDKTLLDIRVLHPNALSNKSKTLPAMYATHEKEKKTKYLHRVLEVEKANFTPLVMATTGGMSPECSAFFKRLAEKLSFKLDQNYSNVISFIRRRIRFDLLKTCLISIRGFKGKYYQSNKIDVLDLNLLMTN